MASAEGRPVYLYVFGSLIAILGLGTAVAAIVFPLLSSKSGSKEGNQCMSNMRQIAAGIRGYAIDFDDTFPAGNRWMDTIARYVEGSDTFNCPSAKNGYGYAYSVDVSGKPMTEIPSPFLEPLAFDSSLVGRSQVGGIDTLPMPARHNRRGAGNVVANVEGGVEYRPSGVIRRPSTGR